MINENVYSEVYEILSYMDKSTVMKIPLEILKTIKNKRNKEYISKIDRNDIFNRENVLKDTIMYIAWLDVNFWETIDEKNRLKDLYFEKLKKDEIEKDKKYQNYELFPEIENEIEYKDKEKNTIIEYKENIFVKIKKLIKNLLNKK